VVEAGGKNIEVPHPQSNRITASVAVEPGNSVGPGNSVSAIEPEAHLNCNRAPRRGLLYYTEIGQMLTGFRVLSGVGARNVPRAGGWGS
jgi:hypothetical protein